MGLGNALVIADLFDGIGLSCCAGLIAPDVVARDGDTIAGDDLTGLKDDDNLVDRLSEDHLDHVNGKKPRAAGIRFHVQQRFRGGVGSEPGVHDDFDPEQLNGSENGLLVRGDGGYEGNDDGSDVCQNPQLEELANGRHRHNDPT